MEAEGLNMHHYGYNLKVWNYIQKVHANYRHLQEQSEVVVVEAHEEHLRTSGVADVPEKEDL